MLRDSKTARDYLVLKTSRKAEISTSERINICRYAQMLSKS